MADISNITVSAEGVDTVCKIKDKVARNDIALNRTTLGYQCKNLLKNNAVTQTINDVTFTVNSDGSITVNGTNTSSSTGANLEICGFKNYGTGKFTASLNSTDSNLYMSVFDNSWVGIGFVCDNEITWDNGNKERYVRLVVKPGATINNVTVYPMIRYTDITDDTYEPYKENIDERLIKNKSDIAVNKSTLGTQCKNLLKNNAVTQTVSGVTFTINDDKSITVNGTATAQISFMINNKVGLGIGNYILTGCPSGGSWNTFYLTAYASSAWLKSPDFGSGCKIENKTVTQVVISIASGYTANNLKFYPMLRDADITDGTYELYKETVAERLIENKSNAAVNRSTLGYQRKNLLKNTAKTSTMSGVTFTVNDDKSVTANGTNSTSNYANIIVFKGELEVGTYTLTGAVSDAFRIRLGMGTSADGYGSYVGVDRGNGYTFTVAEKALYTVTCQVESGKTASNVIFKPMLRYADIMDDTYEPYQPSLQEQINNFGTQQQLLCDYSSAATSSTTIQITGLFSNYSAVICIVKYSYGTINTTLPLKYIKSIGTSKEYSPVSDLNFQYVDDDNLFIGGADAAISNVKIISLY